MKQFNSNSIGDIYKTVTKIEKEFDSLKTKCEDTLDYCKSLVLDQADDLTRLDNKTEDITKDLKGNIFETKQRLYQVKNKLVEKELLSPMGSIRKGEYDSSMKMVKPRVENTLEEFSEEDERDESINIIEG